VTLRFDVSAADAEVIRATLARLRLQGGFGVDCDDGVLLADLARNALVDLEREPPTAERFRVSIHHCPSCENTHVGDPQAPHAADHTDLACAECDAEVLDLTAPTPRLTHAIPPATRRKVFEQHGHRCAVPHCRNRLWLDLHHIRPRSQGGDHRTGNLICLCSAHHRFCTKGRWRSSSTAETQRLRFVLPTGEARRAAARPPPLTIDDIATHVGQMLDEDPRCERARTHPRRRARGRGAGHAAGARAGGGHGRRPVVSGGGGDGGVGRLSAPCDAIDCPGDAELSYSHGTRGAPRHVDPDDDHL
jgi:hypothetical protein